MAEDQARKLLVEAGVLPETMRESVTFNKVREILRELDNSDQGRLRTAIETAGRLGIRGPLQSVIFIKHHLAGEHQVEVDRIDESEDGARLAILVYPEGEMPISVESLPTQIDVGTRLSYDPSEGRYS
jgi:hypothetical protein